MKLAAIGLATALALAGTAALAKGGSASREKSCDTKSSPCRVTATPPGTSTSNNAAVSHRPVTRAAEASPDEASTDEAAAEGVAADGHAAAGDPAQHGPGPSPTGTGEPDNAGMTATRSED